MPIILFSDSQLHLTLAPVGVDDRVPSVGFDIVADFSMPFQKAHIEVKECWFTHEALSGFETQLNSLKNVDSGEAILPNMSDLPIIRVVRKGARLTTIIRATDSAGIGISTIEVSGYATEIPEVLARLRTYEKWW